MAGDYAGLRFQLLVLTGERSVEGSAESGPDLEIPAYLAGGELQIDGDAVPNPAIIAVDLGPGDLALAPGTYRALLRLDDGRGWRVIPASEFYIKLRRLEP